MIHYEEMQTSYGHKMRSLGPWFGPCLSPRSSCFLRMPRLATALTFTASFNGIPLAWLQHSHMLFKAESNYQAVTLENSVVNDSIIWKNNYPPDGQGEILYHNH